MSHKITQKDVNNIVWKACDTFRGIIDPSQYKDYILTMLFLKYVTDVYNEKKQNTKKNTQETKTVCSVRLNVSVLWYPKFLVSTIYMTTETVLKLAK